MAAEKSRDSRKSILKAAVVEFAKHGLSGARIEHIAARSGFNKALVYRYFGSREALFDSALAWKFEQKFSAYEAAPADLGDALVFWFDNAMRDRGFVQLLQREALQFAKGQELPYEESRLDHYTRQLADIQRWRDSHQLDPALPARPLLLLFVALVSFPAFFPNFTRLVLAADEPTMQESWRALLRELARRLAPLPAPPMPSTTTERGA
jgi:AcrR family transcriptional regulator